jgi:hypothetical protein
MIKQYETAEEFYANAGNIVFDASLNVANLWTATEFVGIPGMRYSFIRIINIKLKIHYSRLFFLN